MAMCIRPAALPALLIAAAAAAGAGAQTLPCETLRQQIEAKIRANGAERFTLAIVEQAAQAPGRVVGSCDRGSRKIVYRPGEATREPILTECRDGSVTLGGSCRKTP